MLKPSGRNKKRNIIYGKRVLTRVDLEERPMPYSTNDVTKQARAYNNAIGCTA